MATSPLTQVKTQIEQWPLKGTFTISRGSKTEAEVVTVTLQSDDGHTGRGECTPYARYNETSASVVEQINNFASEHADSFDLATLAQQMHAGAARNALDCALWDLTAKRAGQRVWELTGQTEPMPAITAYTLSLDSVEAMGEQARLNQHRPLLKIKLGPDGAEQRLQAIREQAPQSKLIVDANEAWSLLQLEAAMDTLQQCNVVLIEQPLAADDDEALAAFQSPIPLAADESCHTSADLERLAGRYEVVNIKLDKTGGLSEALMLKAAAHAAGLNVMVGCMMATSLSMAPATLLTDEAMVVDLDGPLWLAQDRQPALRYDNHRITPPTAALWG